MKRGLISVPFGITLIAASTQIGFGQDPSLIVADIAFRQTLAHSDAAGLGKFLDPGSKWIDGGGKVLSKAQVLRGIPKPLIGNEKDAEKRVHSYSDLGDVQVNLGRAHVLRVWVKRSDGWKLIIYQEVISLDRSPAFTPGAGKECENPCKSIPFAPRNDTELEVALAYAKLETAAHARNSAAFGTMVADEFVAVSSNSDKLQTKRSRMEEFDRSKDGGLAPTPLVSARMLAFGDAVLMVSEHKPDRGNPLHVTRVWIKRSGNWVETLSYQTSVAP